jgi:molecular chaperone GrpE (heat shock protein)/DNA-binding Xre family transcriptional regulator
MTNDIAMIPDEPPPTPNSGGFDRVKIALKSRMTEGGIPSLVALSVKAQVSIGAVKRLQNGQVLAMQVQTVAKLAQALEISIEDLMNLGDDPPRSWTSAPLSPLDSELRAERSRSPAPLSLLNSELRAERSRSPDGYRTEGVEGEYDRLLQQFNQQETHLRERFQRETLQTLEPWLLQWSAAAYAAQSNSQLTAIKLLPLLRPIETLLDQWGVSAIGAVGEELAYDPTVHQPMNSEDLAVGTIVRVRFSGYDYQGQVLHRAKVVRV